MKESIAGQGWYAPDGQERFELGEELPGRGAAAHFRAHDKVLDRDVLLALGSDETLLAVLAGRLGRLEHPNAITIYASGRDPGGRVFIASTDPRGAAPLRRELPKMTLEQALGIVVKIANAVAHSSSRNVPTPRIDVDRVLRFPDGEFRIVDWESAAGGAGEPADLAVRRLLGQVLDSFPRVPRFLRRIARHEYAYGSAALVARDLVIYMDGVGTPAAGPLPWARRLSAWARRSPGRAAFALAGSLALALAGTFAGYFMVIHQAHERQRGAERAAALAAANEHLGRIARMDEELQGLISRRRELYHSQESLEPSDQERELDDGISELGSEREAEARLAQTLLERARERGADVDEDLFGLDRGRLATLFAQAAFEEERTICTETLPWLRLTRQVGEALEADDLAGAGQGIDALARAPGAHPYLAAARELHATWKRSKSRETDLAPYARTLVGMGRLVVRAPRELESLRLEIAPVEIVRDLDQRWQLGPARPIARGAPRELPMGDYLVVARRGGDEFRIEVLLERDEDDDLDLGGLPSSVPEGYVWIGGGTFYTGGEGTNPTRYRKARIEHGFAIGRIEVSERIPTQKKALEYCERLSDEIESEGWRAGLPTDLEWELAARGVAGRRYPWGDRFLQIDETSDETRRQTDRSIYGVWDMGGRKPERILTSLDARVVVRGGSGAGSAQESLTASRDLWARDRFDLEVGFRAVLRRDR